MTSELRPAVETRAEVLDQLLSELQDGNAWDSTISLLTDYADLVQDLLKDREAVRAEVVGEIVAWLRKDDFILTADELEAKFGGRDGTQD